MAETTRKHPARRAPVLREPSPGVVSVCEPKPECQKDRGRGDTREECPLGLIRALLSGLRFLSITESGTKERGVGIWLEFQRALASASLSSLGLFFYLFVWFLALLVLFSPLQIVSFASVIRQRREETFVNQNNIDIFLSRLLFHCGRYGGEQRDSCEEKKIIGNGKIKQKKLKANSREKKNAMVFLLSLLRFV